MSSYDPFEIPSMTQIDKKQLQKMVFIMNAMESGWTVKKKDGSYIFTKKHENKREIFQENYLETFVVGNFASRRFMES